MSRPIQIGDIAIVTVDGKESPLTITDIHSSYIEANDYILIPMGDRWIVLDYPLDHSVRFEADLSSMTNIPEIMSQILLPLDYKELIKACQTNKDFNKVCKDDYFWKLKVEHDYGMLSRDKPSDITYRQQYIDLMTSRDVLSAVDRGRLDILKSLDQRGIYPDQKAANYAAELGHLEILKWMAQTRSLYPDQTGANYAAADGYLDILKWLAQTKDRYPDENGADYAALRGHLEVSKWLAQRNIYPDEYYLDEIAGNGHLDILKWLARTKNYYPNQHGVNLATKNGHLDVLKWLAQTKGLYPNQESANLAAANGHLDVLKWLAQTKGLYPDREGLRMAIRYRQLEVSQWLAQNNIRVGRREIYEATTEASEWLAQHGLRPY